MLGTFRFGNVMKAICCCCCSKIFVVFIVLSVPVGGMEGGGWIEILKIACASEQVLLGCSK